MGASSLFCDVNDKQEYRSKKISSLSLLSVLSRASSCAHVFCLPKSKNEQIPQESVHCIKFMQMCQKNRRQGGFFGAPAGIRIIIESPGGAFLAQCKHWARPLSAAPPLMQANPSLSSCFCLSQKRFLQAAVRAAFLVLQRGFESLSKAPAGLSLSSASTGPGLYQRTCR